ncbi:hypothetical protein FXO38_15632 [Capsicum annuum]|nr:hypothetical protein FXO38_15632 [Capsicum annuum]
MTVLVIQVPSIMPELPGSNILDHKIKGQFDDKSFTLLEKLGYHFSKPTRLVELKDDVTGEKIHGLTKEQMMLREQGRYDSTLKFGLGFKLLEPLRISTKKGKETTSSHYASVEKDKKLEDEMHRKIDTLCLCI